MSQVRIMAMPEKIFEDNENSVYYDEAMSMKGAQLPALRGCVERMFSVVAAVMMAVTMTHSAQGAAVSLVEQAPAQITHLEGGGVLVDFGRVAFGNLRLLPPANAGGKITVRFGEALRDGRVDRQPPGSVRYARAQIPLKGTSSVIVAPLPDPLNIQQPRAVLTPPAWGVVLPFRWVEIEGWPGQLQSSQIRRRAAFASDWNDDAATFHSSDEMLNRIWELCRYSIKATTFAGVYVDGDRERVSYEADAYLAQLGQYYSDGGVQVARDTFDRLVTHPTWPTEWAPHMIFMAYADWMQTADTNWLAARYSTLKTKLQFERERSDGLLMSEPAQIKRGDLVDWPAGERDGYVFKPLNTVVNAFHLRALDMMAQLARALHQDTDATDYAAREASAHAAFQKQFFDPERGLYCDGAGTRHTSLHANLFPLAFGLVPVQNRAGVAQWLGGRGMACSVYAAQYLLEGLFDNNCATQALALITAPTDRSWKHMVDSNTTITWEAWDLRYKPNLDWNHAWGAAPANLLPRYVLGVRPLEPGWARVIVQPNPGPLEMAEGRIPTPRGPIEIAWHNGKIFTLSMKLPSGVSAQVQVLSPNTGNRVFVNGRLAAVRRVNQRLTLDDTVPGVTTIETRPPDLGSVSRPPMP